MSERTLKGRAAVVGIGETQYYKHGQAPHPEFRMCLESILIACEDAGLDPREIDGFASFSNDRNDASRIATALGLPELRHASMVWGGGGGGGAGAMGHAAAAIATGMADVVVVHRSLAQGTFGRFGSVGYEGAGRNLDLVAMAPYGFSSPAQRFAFRAQRLMHEAGVKHTAFEAISLACYHHAQQNPAATMHGRPLTAEMYRDSRWISEPIRLYDCCQENDGAAAVILTSAERAADLKQRPAYVVAAAQGSDYRQGQSTLYNDPDFASSNYRSVARRLWEMAGVGPQDVDSVQSYENFTAGVVMALAEHGFFAIEEANEFCTLENLAGPDAKLPLNTSGGNLADCYMHGLELVVEAVRQIRGSSPNQVPDAQLSLVNSGPMVAPASSVLLGAAPA